MLTIIPSNKEEKTINGKRKSLSTPSPLQGTRPCLRGRVSYKPKIEKNHTAPANCPPETGGEEDLWKNDWMSFCVL